MTAALVDDLAGVGVEFEKSCVDCGNIAEWMVWAKHPYTHHENSAFVCNTHKESTEQRWIKVLDGHHRCTCGYIYVGLLEDNFRAMLL